MTKDNIHKVLLFSGFMLLSANMSSQAYAQEAQNAEDVLSAQKPSQQQAIQAEAEEELTEEQLKRKIQLAEEMHRINPVKDQVDSAVGTVAMRLPETERQVFLNAMYSTLNYRAIERISVDAMVEVYSLKELEAMVEYYSKPEARTAGEKSAQYAAVVQPEIIRMIDKAMIRTRTGE